MSINIERLRVTYGRTVAVQELTLTIDTAERFGLLGPNGAGKTSTMHAIAGIVRPASGSVRIDSRGRIGIAPQEVALYPQLSCRENLRFFGALSGLGGRLLNQRIDEVLEIVGLSDYASVRVNQFSGGMMRRLNFAAAILHRPAVLLLDEPTLGVDPQSRALLLDHLRSHLDGTTVIYSTHYMDEVEKICERVAILDQGELIALGRVEDLIKSRARPILEVVVEGCVTEDALLQLGASRLDANCIRVEVDTIGAGLARVGTWASQNTLPLVGVEVVAGTLESVFLDLTGRRLRDETEKPIWYS